MPIKTSEIIGPALDYTVAECEGYVPSYFDGSVFFGDELDVFSPSTNWSQGGPIIEREISKLFKNVGGTYTAQIRHEESHSLVSHKVLTGWTNASGTTPLIAAMRCYVKSKLGDEVEVPDELA